MRAGQEKTAAIVRAYNCDSSRLIAILQEIQAAENYLSQENMELVADMLHIGVSKVYSVATFYENFSLEPKGKHIIKVCDGTACHVRKSGPIMMRCMSIWGWRVSARPAPTPCLHWRRWPVWAPAVWHPR